jgi:hypothetical protein
MQSLEELINQSKSAAEFAARICLGCAGGNPKDALAFVDRFTSNSEERIKIVAQITRLARR